MTLQEVNEKILDVAEMYQIPTIQYDENSLVTGKEIGVATFRCLPKYEFEDKTITIRPVFSCWIREMSEYNVEQMYAIANQCKSIAMCVEELENIFAGQKIYVKGEI